MMNTPSAKSRDFAGDSIPPNCAIIEVHVGELKQLFDAIDPSPFRGRDLDPKAEEFIEKGSGTMSPERRCQCQRNRSI
jgi:hypothetical protein